MEKLKKDLTIARKNLNKSLKILDDIEFYLERSDFENLSSECRKYEQLSEKLVNQSRLLPVTFGFPCALDNVKEVINKENKIVIKNIDNKYFYIKMPVLLNKKEGGNPSYIRTTLFYALRDFFAKNKDINKFKNKCTIVFKHNYSKDRPHREMRDHDNIELNSVVDLIAMFMLTDDNPLYLDHYYLSTNTNDEDSTEIFLVPKDKFNDFLTGGDIYGSPVS